MTDNFQFLMEKKVETAWLLSFYGALLTDNQRQIMRLHFEEDLSLAEIAAQAGVSRQSVYDVIQRAGQQLIAFEEKLGLCKRFRETEKTIVGCLDNLKMVNASADTQKYLENARQALNALRSEEEK